MHDGIRLQRRDRSVETDLLSVETFHLIITSYDSLQARWEGQVGGGSAAVSRGLSRRRDSDNHPRAGEWQFSGCSTTGEEARDNSDF